MIFAKVMINRENKQSLDYILTSEKTFSFIGGGNVVANTLTVTKKKMLTDFILIN